jgi:hypothetical protein
VIEQSNRGALSEPALAESDRVRLARAARWAVLSVPGVRGTDAGPAGMFVTGAGDGERLEGITCVAAPEGGYEVSLRLTAALVALYPLGERVRAAVREVASQAGVELATVSVHFADLAVGGDLR